MRGPNNSSRTIYHRHDIRSFFPFCSLSSFPSSKQARRRKRKIQRTNKSERPDSRLDKERRMISVKIIQTCFTPIKNPLIPSRIYGGKNSILSLGRAKPDDSLEASPPEGDRDKQELLAKIAMLQTSKLRLTDYLDERSAYLTQFAEEAKTEFDVIGENAMKDLDEASARIMENIESRMQAFEESSETNREEIAKSDKELEEFEDEITKALNEGMFFKSLGQSTPPKDEEKVKEAKEEAKMIKEVVKETAASKTRKNIYLALIGVVTVGIADSFLDSSSDWRKVAVLGAVLVALLSRFIYEQRILSENEKQIGNKSDREQE